MNKSKVLNLLGLAKRARKIVVGSDSVEKALQSGEATMVFVGKDSSDNTKDKFNKKCFYYNVPLDLSFDSVEIGQAIGKPSVKTMALCDQGFKESIVKLIKDGDLNER